MKAIRFHEFGAPEVLRYEDAPLAVASSRHEAFLRELGADEFIDYTQTKPEDDVRDVDLVVDAVGGEPLSADHPSGRRAVPDFSPRLCRT